MLANQKSYAIIKGLIQKVITIILPDLRVFFINAHSNSNSHCAYGQSNYCNQYIHSNYQE